jgi:hypothetical protein
MTYFINLPNEGLFTTSTPPLSNVGFPTLNPNNIDVINARFREEILTTGISKNYLDNVSTNINFSSNVNLSGSIYNAQRTNFLKDNASSLQSYFTNVRYDLFPTHPFEEIIISAILRTPFKESFTRTTVPVFRNNFVLSFGDFQSNVVEFLATINGTTLNVVSVVRGSIERGMVLSATGSIIDAGTRIRGFEGDSGTEAERGFLSDTGTGSEGTYTINFAQTRALARYIGYHNSLNGFLNITIDSNDSLAFGGYEPHRLPISFDQRVVMTNSQDVISASVSKTNQIFADISFVGFKDLEAGAFVSSSANADLGYDGFQVMASSVLVQSESSANISAIFSISASSLSFALVESFFGAGTQIRISGGLFIPSVSSGDLLVEKRKSGMLLFVDLPTRKIVDSLAFLRPVVEIPLTRNDLTAIDVRFIKEGKIVKLSEGSTGRVGIKNLFTEEVLASDNSWSEVDLGEIYEYHFSLDLENEAVNSLFLEEEPPFVNVFFEIEWTEANSINTTFPCNSKLFNKVLL